MLTYSKANHFHWRIRKAAVKVLNISSGALVVRGLDHLGRKTISMVTYIAMDIR